MSESKPVLFRQYFADCGLQQKELARRMGVTSAYVFMLRKMNDVYVLDGKLLTESKDLVVVDGRAFREMRKLTKC